MIYDIIIGTQTYRLELTEISDPPCFSGTLWKCLLNGHEITAAALQISPSTLSILLDGKSFEVHREGPADKQQLTVSGMRCEVSVQDARSLQSRKRKGANDAGTLRLTASMPGKVVRVAVSEGDKVRAGEGIVVVEAMKMQNEIRSPKEGIVKKLLARVGANVIAGDVLAIVE